MQEEFYETADLPESDQQTSPHSQEKFESEHIESIHLDAGAAYQRFKGKTVASDDVDFSDSLVHRRRKGYGGGQYVLELMGLDSGEQETAVQKFNRLHNETSQLAEQLRNIKTEAEKRGKAESEGEVSAKDVAALQHQLKQLQVEQILGQNVSVNLADPHSALSEKILSAVSSAKTRKPEKGDGPGGAATTYELLIHPDQSADAKTTKVADIESRLAKLEALVGTSDAEKLATLTGDVRCRGLVDAVECLSQKTQMLNTNHVDAVDARLGILLQKMSQISEKSQQLEAEDLGKVNELYEQMKKWDSFCVSLPQLVARMQSLSELHQQALQFSQSLTQLDGVQQQLGKTLETDSSLLNELRNGLVENMNLMMTNCELLHKRLKDLDKK